MFYVDYPSWCSRWRHLLLLLFICYVNLCVFFLLVHDVSVPEKQLICVRSRVLNLYGVYLVHVSLLVVFIFIYFLNAFLCFANDLSFWKNIEVLVSFSPFAPLSVLASFVPGQFWDNLCPENMGPSVPTSMGPSVPSVHEIAS